MSSEIIEYKSNGHPDTLTDNIVEACAKCLDEFYLKKYGDIKHYNVDKALFLAGDIKIWYGGGEIIKIPEFILGGQVTKLTDELKYELINTIRATTKYHLPRLTNLDIQIKCNNVAENLSNLSRSGGILANDTSFGVGYYPFSNDEKLMFVIIDRLNCLIEHGDIPLGELYKVMLTPTGIYISAPLYADKVHSRNDYAFYKQKIEASLKDLGNIIFNPDFESGFPYMTLVGSSVECGDDGQVGRGNRYNGLITPCKPMTIEAYHGKNNKNHTGKLYSKWAFEKAKQIFYKTGKQVKVILVSKIGKPIADYELYVEYL